MCCLTRQLERTSGRGFARKHVDCIALLSRDSAVGRSARDGAVFLAESCRVVPSGRMVSSVISRQTVTIPAPAQRPSTAINTTVRPSTPTHLASRPRKLTVEDSIALNRTVATQPAPSPSPARPLRIGSVCGLNWRRAGRSLVAEPPPASPAPAHLCTIATRHLNACHLLPFFFVFSRAPPVQPSSSLPARSLPRPLSR
jgi:hypothetical protein